VSTPRANFSQQKKRQRGSLPWTSGFVVFGAMVALPGILPAIGNIDLDADPRQTGSRFLVFELGFLLASGLSAPLLKKFGIRSFAVTGLSLAAAGLLPLPWLITPLPHWQQLLPVSTLGFATGLVSITSLFALKPWSSRSGATALLRFSGLACLGCVFSSLTAGVFHTLGWSRFSPLTVAAAALVCLDLCLTGREPLTVVPGRRAPPLDTRFLHLRSIASSLLLCLLFVQLGSEWSVATWLPLFLMHRLGTAPAAAAFYLSFYFSALLFGRVAASRLTAKLTGRTLAISGMAVTLAGCLILSLSTSILGISLALITLAAGFAPPYLIVKNVLEESLHLEPGFYRLILMVAVSGAMCSAWLLGHVLQFFGMRGLGLFPALGSVVVFTLELLLLFESHLMRERAPAKPDQHAAGGRFS
jgi:fucose permease